MIKGIVSFLVLILEGLAKLVAFLLVGLSLWIPLVYSIAFIIICLVTGVKITTIMPIFILGLILCIVISVAVDIYRLLTVKKRKSKIKKAPKNDIAPIKKADSEVEYTEKNSPPINQTQPQQEQNDNLNNNSSFAGNMYQNNYGNIGGNFIPYNQNNYSANQNNYNTPQNGYNYSSPNLNNNFMIQNPEKEEKPRIFRTRMDPNLLIYEYSNRLDYYKNIDGNWTMVSSEPKNK